MMPLTKTKKGQNKNSSRYSDKPTAALTGTNWWKEHEGIIAILISLVGVAITWGVAMNRLGKIEQEFRDNIRYNYEAITDLKQKQETLQSNHHSLAVEFNIQKTKIEFLEKDSK